MSDKDEPKHETQKSPFSARRAKKLRHLTEYLLKQETKNNSLKVSRILKKSEHERTDIEKEHLDKHADIVKRIRKNKEKRQISAQRTQELEDNEDVLQSKCDKLADILKKSRKTVIYTGAGISTAASIPDYRGPQGVWTLLKKGEQIEAVDLSDAEPTLTHMCIRQLHKKGHVNHVVSQNCDGLHVRSGLPREVLSEVHGNMFIELCYNCMPHREYVRLFDVTENTGVRRHVTGRKCTRCHGDLKDTIVHFGERGGVKSPYRWKEATRAANKCDLILCLGSSLKILKRYACLWCMDRVKQKRPKLVIVNLQWTPKDESATIKINGKCDDVMQRVMTRLGYSIPVYESDKDPLYHLATPLAGKESDTTSKKVLERPYSITKKNKHGHSRSPTPSDSESSDDSTYDDDSDTEIEDFVEIEQTLKNGIKSKNNIRNHKSKDTEAGHSGEVSKTGIKYKTNSCLEKSARICNEAKITMQTRIVKAKIDDLCGVNNISDNVSDKADDGPDAKSDPEQSQNSKLRLTQAGPFDPGPDKFEDKLAYLHSLQAQLEVLKEKQRSLKAQEGSEALYEDGENKDMGQQLGELRVNIDRKTVEDEITLHRQSMEWLCKEKAELESLRIKISQDFAELEYQATTAHQNDQLRMHQHFLIHEQLLAQSTHRQEKKDELFKQFVCQQQLLISQQSMQVEELRQRYRKELQANEAAISQKQLDIKAENNKIIEAQRKLKSNVQLVSPTKTDHSITSILKHENTEDVKARINKDGGICTLCETCKFLKDYGVLKRKCQKCHLIRVKLGLAQPDNLANSSTVPVPTYENNLDNTVDRLTKRCKTDAACESSVPSTVSDRGNNSFQKVEATVSSPYTEISTSIKSEPLWSLSQDSFTAPNSHSEVPIPAVCIKSEPEFPSSSSLLSSSVNETSSPSKSSLSTSSKSPKSSSTSSKSPKSSSATSSIGPGTLSRGASSSSSDISASASSRSLSRLNSNTVTFTLCDPENSEVDESKVKVEVESPDDENILKTLENCDSVIKIERISGYSNSDMSDEKQMSELDKLKRLKSEDNSVEEKLTCQKPTRSHSQSEIYRKETAADGQEVIEAGSRYIRSHSTSDATGTQQAELELSSVKSEGNLENAASAKKRKGARCLSVPGWFGKGLNIKKKRR